MKKLGISRRFLGWHTWILLGYSLFGRGFSYVGIAPLYIGEITLFFGFLTLLLNRSLSKLIGHHLPQLFRQPAPCLLAIFVIWCILQTIPYVPRYGIDSIRDAAMYYYSFYAFIIAIILTAKPDLLLFLLRRYRRFIIVFLLVLPITWTIFQAGIAPDIPGAPAKVIDIKIADAMAHLSGCLAFFVALKPPITAFLLLFLVNVGYVGSQANRSGTVAFALAFLVVGINQIQSKRLWQILIVVGIVLTFIIALNPNLISVVSDKVATIFSDEGSSRYQGTKEWRQKWWTKIINYTFYGEYFWTGRGFGINLATVDGFDPFQNGVLRSPHNGHINLLARTGVPGFILWLCTQASWGSTILWAYIHSRLRGLQYWSGLFMTLFTYWAAFMTTTTFEVIIEGPTGAIWIWTIFGVGIAAVQIYRTTPELLDLSLKQALEPSPEEETLVLQPALTEFKPESNGFIGNQR